MSYIDNLKKSFIPEFLYVIIIYIILKIIYNFIQNYYSDNYLFDILFHVFYIILFTYLFYNKDLDICNKDGNNKNYTIINPIYTSVFFLFMLMIYLIIIYILSMFRGIPVLGIIIILLNIKIIKHIIGFLIIYIIYNLITSIKGEELCLTPPGIDRMKSKINALITIMVIYFLFIIILCFNKDYLNERIHLYTIL